MLSVNNRKFILLLIVALLISSVILLSVTLYKPDISTCTLEELCDIRGIDETLANRVLVYLKSNPEANIDDIDDVKGFGEYRVNLLRQKWSD